MIIISLLVMDFRIKKEQNVANSSTKLTVSAKENVSTKIFPVGTLKLFTDS